MIIKPLIWDSDFFGVSVSQITLPDNFREYSKLALLLDDRKSLYYIFAQKINEETSLALKGMGAILIERRVEFEIVVDSTSKYVIDPEIRACFLLDYNLLEDLVFAAGEYSRFNRDERLRPFFKNLYSAWLEKSLSRELADIVYGFGSPPIGFIAAKIEVSRIRITLVAVTSGHRGQGIGSALLDAVFRWGLERGFSTFCVVTQICNVRACEFYSKSGFTRADEQYVYHLWSD